MKSIELFQEKPLLADKIELSPTSLVVVGEMNEDDYRYTWRKFAHVHGGTQFWIGDLYNAQGSKYGTAKLFAKEHGLEIRAIEDCAYVCGNVQSTVRTVDLSFGHHKLVAPMEPALQREWLEEAVRHDWTVAELRNAIRDSKPVPEIPDGEYNVIYADPPWEFDNAGFEQSAASHYPTMATTKIAELAIPNARVLFLWATSAMLEDSLFVMKEWGYQYKTNLIWIKDKGPSIGWFATSRHELLLIGTNESGAHPRWKPVSWINASVTQHSRKPDEFYEVIEKMYDGPYLEMFARRDREGWESWGNEIQD